MFDSIMKVILGEHTSEMRQLAGRSIGRARNLKVLEKNSKRPIKIQGFRKAKNKSVFTRPDVSKVQRFFFFRCRETKRSDRAMQYDVHKLHFYTNLRTEVFYIKEKGEKEEYYLNICNSFLFIVYTYYFFIK